MTVIRETPCAPLIVTPGKGIVVKFDSGEGSAEYVEAEKTLYIDTAGGFALENTSGSYIRVKAGVKPPDAGAPLCEPPCDIPMIMDINAFANRCGYFFCADTDPEYEGCETVNNGYNCCHPGCRDGCLDEETGKYIGACHSYCCPFGDSPDNIDLVEHGVISEEDVDPSDLEWSDWDYITIHDEDMVKKLREAGETGLATK